MKKLLLALLMVLVFAFSSHGATLFWSQELPDPNDLAGWRVYQSHAPGTGYFKVKEIPFVSPSTEYSTEITISSPVDSGTKTFYFVITSFDTSQNESGYSNEVMFSVTDVIAPKVPFIIRIIGQ